MTIPFDILISPYLRTCTLSRQSSGPFHVAPDQRNQIIRMDTGGKKFKLLTSWTTQLTVLQRLMEDRHLTDASRTNNRWITRESRPPISSKASTRKSGTSGLLFPTTASKMSIGYLGCSIPLQLPKVPGTLPKVKARLFAPAAGHEQPSPSKGSCFPLNIIEMQNTF